MRAKVRSKAATTFLERELHFAKKLVVVRHGFLRLAREWNPDAREVNRDRDRPDGQRALRLREVVRLPIGVVDRLADRACFRLVLKRNTIRKTHDLGRLVGGKIS